MIYAWMSCVMLTLLLYSNAKQKSFDCMLGNEGTVISKSAHSVKGTLYVRFIGNFEYETKYSEFFYISNKVSGTLFLFHKSKFSDKY